MRWQNARLHSCDVPGGRLRHEKRVSVHSHVRLPSGVFELHPAAALLADCRNFATRRDDLALKTRRILRDFGKGHLMGRDPFTEGQRPAEGGRVGG